MCKEAGEPKNSHAQQVKSAEDRDGRPVNEDDAIFGEQDAYTYKILKELNQEILKDTFGEDDSASELQDDTPEFSQEFMDNMRAIVEEHFGPKAAEQFAAQTNNQTIQQKNNIHHQPKPVPETE